MPSTPNMYNFALLLENGNEKAKYAKSCAILSRKNALVTEASAKTTLPVYQNAELYFKKIDDANDALMTVSVDISEVTEFLSKIEQSNLLSETPLTMYFKSTEEIGKIRPEYVTQFTNEAISILNDIVNGKRNIKDIKAYFSQGIENKLKRQAIPLKNGITDVKTYLLSQGSPAVLPVDKNTIMTVCIPFLRTFDVNKKLLQGEVASIKNAVVTDQSAVSNWKVTIDRLKADGKVSADVIDCANYFLFNMSSLLENIHEYLSFVIITKLSTYLFDIRSLLELHEKAVNYRPEGSDIYHEMAFEDSVISSNINDMVNAIIQGDGSSLVEWADRVYRGCRAMVLEKIRGYDDVKLGLLLDQYEEEEYPFSTVFQAIDMIQAGVNRVRGKVKDNFCVVKDVFASAGFDDSLSSRFISLFETIESTQRYQDAIFKGYSKERVLCMILAELRGAPETLERLVKEIQLAERSIDSLSRFTAEEDSDDCIKNAVVRVHAAEATEKLANDYKNFIGVVCTSIAKRYKQLEEMVNAQINLIDDVYDVPTPYENPEMEASLMEVTLEYNRICQMVMMESEIIKFKNDLLHSRYGIVTEAETPTDGGKETTKAEVEEDPSKMSDADKKQNKDAATMSDKKEPQTPEEKQSFSEKMKGLSSKLEETFKKALDGIKASFAKSNPDNTAFLEANKDAILNRSYNGISLNMVPCQGITSEMMLSDLRTMSNNINAITADTIGKYADTTYMNQTLFSFVKMPSDGMSDTFLRNYYKIGPTATSNPVRREKISNAALKSLAEKMIAELEDANSGKLDAISSAADDLKSAWENKVNSFTALDGTGISAVSAVSHAVSIMATAILTGYQYRISQFRNGLNGLVPKNNAAAGNEPSSTEETQPSEQPTSHTPENGETVTA